MFEGVAQGWFEETVAEELLKASEDWILGDLRDGWSTFEIDISFDDLAEEKVESVLGEGRVHECLVVF